MGDIIVTLFRLSGWPRAHGRVFLLNRRVLLIRPKLHLANDGNYRCDPALSSTLCLAHITVQYKPLTSTEPTGLIGLCS